MNRRARRPNVFVVLALWITSALAGLPAALLSCSATPHQVTHVAVLGAADLVQQLVDLNEQAYRSATAGVPAHALEPYETEFDKRTHALAAMSAGLYAAAAINDAVGATPAQRALAARQALAAISDGVDILTDGTLLPAIALTPAQRSVLHAVLDGLGAIAFPAGHDAGTGD